MDESTTPVLESAFIPPFFSSKLKIDDFFSTRSIIQEEREALEAEQADADSEKAEKSSV